MVKFLHIRAIDEDGNLLVKGGVTIAYTVTDKDIIYQAAMCHPELDHFCYSVGRAIASGRLKSKKWEPTIIDRKDPISAAIVQHVAENLFIGPVEISYNKKSQRWESLFQPLVPDEIPFQTHVAEMDSPYPNPI